MRSTYFTYLLVVVVVLLLFFLFLFFLLLFLRLVETTSRQKPKALSFQIESM